MLFCYHDKCVKWYQLSCHQEQWSLTNVSFDGGSGGEVNVLLSSIFKKMFKMSEWHKNVS